MQIYDFSCLRYIPKLILEKQVVDKLQVRSSENNKSYKNNVGINRNFNHSIKCGRLSLW